MKLVTYAATDGSPRAGILTESGIVDIARASGESLPNRLLDVMAAPDWKTRLDALVASGAEADVDAASTRLLAPLDRPGKLLAAAGNFQAHVDEGGGAKVDKSRRTPRVFLKPATTLVGPDDPVVLPNVSSQVDWELELAVVIGSTAKEVSVESALDYVGGYAVFNDISARSMDWGIENREVHDWDKFFDWLTGKWVDTFAPMGPWIVTPDEIDDPDALAMRLEVNGEVWQDDTTGSMIFDCADLISFCSRITTLEPGDIIATGTPAGCGVASGRFLSEGDVMVGSIEKLGTLRTPVVS